MKKGVFGVILLGVLALIFISMAANNKNAQSITTLVPTKNQEVGETPSVIVFTKPTETQVLIKEPASTEIPSTPIVLTSATSTLTILTPTPPEEIYPLPQVEPKEVMTPTPCHSIDCVSPESIEELQEEMTEIEKRCPITKILPYGGPFYEEPFFIDPPTKEGIIWISTDKDTNQEETREAALDWIRGQGYDPDNLGCKIRFEVVEFPK